MTVAGRELVLRKALRNTIAAATHTLNAWKGEGTVDKPVGKFGDLYTSLKRLEAELKTAADTLALVEKHDPAPGRGRTDWRTGRKIVALVKENA